MADVRMSSVFPAGATVRLVQRRSDEEHVSGDVEAEGVVEDDSTLEITGLAPGTYWAQCDGHPSVQVRAKEWPGKWERAPRGDVGEPAGSEPSVPAWENEDLPPAARGEVPEVADDGDRTPKQTPQFRPDEVVTNAQPGRFVSGARTSANAHPVTETDKAQTTTGIVPTSNRTPDPPADDLEARHGSKRRRRG